MRDFDDAPTSLQTAIGRMLHTRPHRLPHVAGSQWISGETDRAGVRYLQWQSLGNSQRRCRDLRQDGTGIVSGALFSVAIVRAIRTPNENC